MTSEQIKEAIRKIGSYEEEINNDMDKKEKIRIAEKYDIQPRIDFEVRPHKVTVGNLTYKASFLEKQMTQDDNR